jgi:hypothetical protein
VFAVRSVPRLYNNDQSVRVESLESVYKQSVESCSEKLVAAAGDSSGNQAKGNVRRWKPLPSSAVKTVTENTSLCVAVICKV